MGKRDKLLERLQKKPKNFTWSELTTLLTGLGYREFTGGKSGGSRRRFAHAGATAISLHKPYPGNVLKQYAVRDVLKALEEGGLIWWRTHSSIEATAVASV